MDTECFAIAENIIGECKKKIKTCGIKPNFNKQINEIDPDNLNYFFFRYFNVKGLLLNSQICILTLKVWEKILNL